jgi:hypothetical protein
MESLVTMSKPEAIKRLAKRVAEDAVLFSQLRDPRRVNMPPD